ncbi:MAG: ferredoxin [Acidimicrobiia bacterium]|nr:ferredoxin [Acidimicrobiia bacterium]
MSGDLVAVAVEEERCIGGGQCEMLEPEVFLLDDDEAISSVIGSGVLPRPRAEVVVHRCPGAAISIVEHPEASGTDG